MNNLPFSFLLILSFYELSFGKKDPEFSLSFENVDYCKNTRYRDYVILDNLHIWPNFTGSGYIEIIENFPVTSTLKLHAYHQVNRTWVQSRFSPERQNMCQLIEKDLWFIPVARMVVAIPERCPIRKSKLYMNNTILHKRVRGVLPVGCFKVDINIKNEDETLMCLSVITKLATYSQRNDYVCIKP